MKPTRETVNTTILAVSPRRAIVRTNFSLPLHTILHRLASLNVKRDTGAEIAVLDGLLKNGTHLDLRAFTLVILPDISLMFNTLVAIDLSYNCLRVRLRLISLLLNFFQTYLTISGYTERIIPMYQT